MPGKPSYAYHRPFDYFDLQFTSSTGSRFENIFTRGLLAGTRSYGEGADRSRGSLGPVRQLRLRRAADLPGVERRAFAWEPPRSGRRQDQVRFKAPCSRAWDTARAAGSAAPTSTDYHYGLTPQVLGGAAIHSQRQNGGRSDVPRLLRQPLRLDERRIGEHRARRRVVLVPVRSATMQRQSDTSGHGAPRTAANRCSATSCSHEDRSGSSTRTSEAHVSARWNFKKRVPM